MADLTAVDLVLIGAYFVTIFVLGLWRSGRGDSAADFLVAGRRLTLPAFVASLVSTWYGGILGVGEYSYRFGISNWVVFGVPYYLYALIFALFLAARARRSQHTTIPDQLERAYGRRAAVAGAGFIFLLTLPAPYLLMLAILIRLLWPVPLWAAVVFSGLFSLLYIWRSGLLAVVRTDMLQFVLMFLGFIVLVASAAAKYGGMHFLQQHLPAQHWQWHGGQPLQYILVWYVIAMATLVDPNFYQRCYAARSEAVARRSILIAIFFWGFFYFLTTTAGLYARAILPALDSPAESYPRLAAVLLPQGLRGLFFVALFATIMSTLDSFFFVAAITLGKDMLAQLRRLRRAADFERLTRAGMWLTLLLSAVLAVAVPSVIDLWYQLGSVATPALLVPLAASFSQRWRMRGTAALAAIVASGGLSLLWLLASLWRGENLLHIEPIFPGLLLSILIWIFDHSRAAKTEGD